MADIVERLRELEAVESELACECDCPPEATANYRYAITCAEAADEIDRLRNELHIAQEWSARVIAGHEQDMTEITALRAEVERLARDYNTARGAHDSLLIENEKLRDEVRVWVAHTKTAVWSDTEECKFLNEEVTRLVKSRNRWAQKYNDLLNKRRAEDGYDVYAAAREEYRKKIDELAAKNEKLRAALEEVRVLVFGANRSEARYPLARAALEEKP